jgi:hypothetical protein
MHVRVVGVWVWVVYAVFLTATAVINETLSVVETGDGGVTVSRAPHDCSCQLMAPSFTKGGGGGRDREREENTTMLAQARRQSASTYCCD